ncbi:MAG TPA: penicillin-binding protein 1A [Thermopetrobacter sp.]|nr:penicillin-binding protein 1A [Thermopetrobacter sp.]
MLRLLGYLFSVGFVFALALAVGVGYVIWETSRTLPDTKALENYQPKVVTRVHAADGSLLAEYAHQRRLFVPIDAIPKKLIEAVISAEDKNFYHHIGIDVMALGRAMFQNLMFVVKGRKRRFIGASTITQQVAKNFLLSNERTLRRKIREALIALKIEATFSKNRILELYLNEIYLGRGAYGVAGAALTYFGKTPDRLSLPEIAYLAALPKKPGRLDPVKHHKAALERRDWVLGRMLENGYISRQEHDEAVATPLKVNPRTFGVKLFAGESFTEEVRRQVRRLYGNEVLYEGGLSVRTTLDPKLQIMARHALARGLLAFDRKKGWRGPVAHVSLAAGGDWRQPLAKRRLPGDLAPWRLGIVLEVTDEAARVGLKPDGATDRGRIVSVPLANMAWARRHIPGRGREPGRLGPPVKKVSDVLRVGDIIHVAPDRAGAWHLMQVPDVQGAMVVMDPHTGRVKALVGGFSYGLSQFNRATQAKRQPGSAIKPFVYAAALDNGYTPASVVLDAPIEIEQRDGTVWKPQNYSKKFYGPSTLRRGIEQSRNVMTVRLARDMGIEKFTRLAVKMGIYDRLPAYLPMALGAGETSLLRLITAYAMLANGGKKVEAAVIDRIQDRYGRTVYRHDKRQCPKCKAARWDNQPEPEIVEKREEVINPYTAYQITQMLQGVIRRGTAKKAFEGFPWPVAGKTGTTNDYRDAWFVGYVPDLVAGVYVGYDKPRHMGKQATGGHLAAPIVADFLRMALKGKPPAPFRTPPGIELIPIDPKTGRRAAYGDPDVILEPFKPGNEPPEDGRPVIGEDSGVVAARGPQPDISGGVIDAESPSSGGAARPRRPTVKSGDGGLATGTGGLY